MAGGAGFHPLTVVLVGTRANNHYKDDIIVALVAYTHIICIYIWATVKISEDQFSREGLKMTSDMHETL